MACHTVNMAFRALKLGYPSVVECEVASRVPSETFPFTSRIRFEFPERDGLPPLKFWWYDGNPDAKSGIYSKLGFINPLRPDGNFTREIIASRKTLPSSGCLVIGDKGKLFSPDDYGSQFQVLLNDETVYQDGKTHEACKAVAQTIPRSPGHDKEWFEMMKGGPAAYSNFDIAAYLTEIILLGCVALRVGVGRRLDWDGPNMKAKNTADAEQFVKRQSRAGWGRERDGEQTVLNFPQGFGADGNAEIPHSASSPYPGSTLVPRVHSAISFVMSGVMASPQAS